MVTESPEVPSLEELIALIKAQAAQIAGLVARVAELERRLGLNSSNSGKPPSSDGLRKPARVARLRDTIKATVGFEKPGEATHTPAKSLIRMFCPCGNPQARNLFGVIGYLQRQAGIELYVQGRER